MHAVLSVLLPIFGLILAGALCGRRGWLGAGATDSLNRFVVRLALPAELFQSMAEVTRVQVDHPAFVAAYVTAMLATFAVGFGLDRRRPVDGRSRLSGAAIEGLAASYANTAFIGIPLCLGVFGPRGLPPVVLATLLTVCALFALAIALVELDLQTGRGAARTLARVVGALLRNPLVAAPLLGIAVNLSGLGLGAPVLRFTGLLGDAASPCALITIGLFLAETAGRPAPGAAVARTVALKAAAAAVADRAAGVRRVPDAAALGAGGGADRRPADRHRPVHAGPAVWPRGRDRRPRHAGLDDPVAADGVGAAGLDRVKPPIPSETCARPIP